MLQLEEKLYVTKYVVLALKPSLVTYSWRSWYFNRPYNPYSRILGDVEPNRLRILIK